jgi:hypothetical protein
LAVQAIPRTKELCFWHITPKPKIGILEKLVRLEAVLNHMFTENLRLFGTNIASTMACPNFKKPKKWPLVL